MTARAVDIPQVPIGDWFESLVEWLLNNVSGLFHLIDVVIQAMVDGLETALLWPPTLVMVAVFALISLLLRGWRLGLFTAVSFLLVVSMEQWENAMSSLALVLVASVIAVLFAVPLGVYTGRNLTAARVVRPVLDFMQTMPAFVYLIPAITFFSIGKVPGVVATVVFAMPPGVRLTELGIRRVDTEMVEAGYAFGAPPWDILRGIQMPLAMPTIMAGVNQVIMLALSMVVIAGMVGAGGLGAVVFEGITRLDIGLGFEGGLAVVVLAIFLDRTTGALGERSAVARAERTTAGR
ncbi:MAG TPA: proline/glycine betaine ABC transporter permease [Nocardioidaceae bacterium]|nr:proline/glycine betaine ABC transporter permease [Nocardioidaceae bacterium]